MKTFWTITGLIATIASLNLALAETKTGQSDPSCTTITDNKTGGTVAQSNTPAPTPSASASAGAVSGNN